MKDNEKSSTNSESNGVLPSVAEATEAYVEAVHAYQHRRHVQRLVRSKVGDELGERHGPMRQHHYYSVMLRDERVRTAERLLSEAFGRYQLTGQLLTLSMAQEGLTEIPNLPGIRPIGESFERQAESKQTEPHSAKVKRFEELVIKVLTEQGKMSKSKLIDACIEAGWPKYKRWMHEKLIDLAENEDSTVIRKKVKIRGRDTHVYSVES